MRKSPKPSSKLNRLKEKKKVLASFTDQIENEAENLIKTYGLSRNQKTKLKKIVAKYSSIILNNTDGPLTYEELRKKPAAFFHSEQPTLNISWSVGDAFSVFCEPSAFHVLNDNTPTSAENYLMGYGSLATSLKPIMTLRDLGKLLGKFVSFLEKNRASIIRAGSPQVPFLSSTWLNLTLSNLYQNRIAMQKEVGSDFRFEKLFRCKIKFIKIVQKHSISKNAHQLIQEVQNLIKKTFTSDEINHLLLVDGISYKALAPEDSCPGGLSDLLMLLYHVFEEIKFNTRSKIAQSLPGLVFSISGNNPRLRTKQLVMNPQNQRKLFQILDENNDANYLPVRFIDNMNSFFRTALRGKGSTKAKARNFDFLKINPKNPSNGNFIKDAGDFLEIKYDGKKVSIKHSTGLRYICELIRAGGRCISASQLQRGTQYHLGSQLSQDEDTNIQVSSQLGMKLDVTDKKSISNISQKIKSLREELEESQELNDGRAAAINQAIIELNKYVHQSIAPNGKIKSFEDNKIRKSVSNAISRDIDRIKSKHSSLGVHLKRSIKSGSSLVYHPDPPTEWDFL